ncbi:MAG: class I SAM-dependent methyltransferase [Leptospiraceae bacterium]|nr:class I SAM-dependent methyltransferase [Leptospiraceae bacterium]
MPQYETFEWYDEPLYYDIIFDTETETEANFLELAYERYSDSKLSTCLEPACGSGRLLLELARRDWQCTGLDNNSHMLDFARQRLRKAKLSASLLEADMSAFRIPGKKFGLAYCLVSTFKYLLSETRARSHLECVAAALQPGGIYVLGFHLTPLPVEHIEREEWQAERDEVAVECVIESWPPDLKRRREKMRNRFQITEKGNTRYVENHWQFRTYTLAQWQKLLGQVPQLQMVAVYDFHYDIHTERELDQELIDAVFILKKTQAS